MIDKKQENIGQLMLKVKELTIEAQRLQYIESEKLTSQKQLEYLNKQVNVLEVIVINNLE